MRVLAAAELLDLHRHVADREAVHHLEAQVAEDRPVRPEELVLDRVGGVEALVLVVPLSIMWMPSRSTHKMVRYLLSRSHQTLRLLTLWVRFQ